MIENILLQFEVLPGHLANHLLITVLPLMLGVAISLPLAIFSVRVPAMRYPTLTAVSIVQTIPSLALLALMVPILAALSSLTMWLMGLEISALGFYPTVIALTLYSMLPMLRNTVTGILGVDPTMTEAARGVGMTTFQTLWMVELPLALPVIIAGLRTATVWTVGIATLATPVGQRCLGNYIFSGLQTRNWTAVLFGCIAAAILAILLDLLIGGLQKAAEERRRSLALLSGIALGAVLLCGLAAPSVVDWARGVPQQRAVIVGSKTFTEQYILAELIAERLQKAGFEVRKRESLGSTVVFDGLVNGEVDCYVDYTGTIWANHMQREGSAPPATVLNEIIDWLKQTHGAQCLGSLGFENAYALAMRREQAEKLGIESIADLARHAPQLKIGSDYEFFSRPEWQALREAYGLEFADRDSFDSTFMYQAVNTGRVDVISAFTSDGRIEKFDLVLLDDPKNAVPPYDAVILLSPNASRRTGLAEALAPLIGAIDVETMRQANFMVDRDENKKTVSQATDWLSQQIAP